MHLLLTFYHVLEYRNNIASWVEYCGIESWNEGIILLVFLHAVFAVEWILPEDILGKSKLTAFIPLLCLCLQVLS